MAGLTCMLGGLVAPLDARFPGDFSLVDVATSRETFSTDPYGRQETEKQMGIGYWVYSGNSASSDSDFIAQGGTTGGADFPEVGVVGSIAFCALIDSTDPCQADVRFTGVSYLDEQDIPRTNSVNGPVFQQDRVTRVNWSAQSANGRVSFSALFLQTD